MISDEQVAQIRHLFHAEHWKIGTIAAELDVHPDTVHRPWRPTAFAAILASAIALPTPTSIFSARPCSNILACAPPTSSR